MTVHFTVEEANLIGVFNAADRFTAIGQLRESMQNDDGMEPEMRELAQTLVARLEAMTDEEYAAIDLTADYDVYDEDEMGE
jgi:hypothetical protein